MSTTFGAILDSVQKMTGDFSGGTSNHYKRWINDARQHLWELVHGNYKEKTDYLTTTEAYSTGTVAITKGDTALTGTSTVWTAAMANRLIEIGGSEPWYRIASIGGNTAAVLADGFVSTTVTAASYQIHTFMWSLPSDVQRLMQVSVQRPEHWTTIPIIDRTDFYQQMPVPLRWSEGVPEVCWLDEEDSSGNLQLGIWPVPEEAALVQIRYEKSASDLSNDSDSLDIPGAGEYILNDALVSAFTFKGRKQEAMLFEQKREKALSRLLSTVSRGKMTTFRRQDHTDASSSRRGQVNMGAWYPRN